MFEEELEQVNEQLAAEEARWIEAGLPFVGDIYRMGPNEFMHHVHVLAIERILTDVLDVSPEQIELMKKTVFLEEWKSTYDLAMQKRAASLRNAIVDGIGVIKPRPE